MKLAQYKTLLDSTTHDHLGYKDESKSRYQSFKKCIDYLGSVTDPEVLELGTSHSYVSGGFEGCDIDDQKYWDPNDFSKWDFGAGVFTLIFGQTGCKMTTVDIISDHIKRCKIMTDSLHIRCDHIVSDSTKFLSTTNKQFDLIYLDAGYFALETYDLQLKEAQTIVSRNLLKPGGLILIDDVKNPTVRKLNIDPNNNYGRSDKSLPYLLANGFDLIFEGYQYILRSK